MHKQQLYGYIFGCTNATREECLDKDLFGAPYGRLRSVQKLKRGCCLFLYNYQDKTLSGMYRAITDGMENIDKYAWDGQFPAQVKFERTDISEVLSYDKYISILDDIGTPKTGKRMFNYELSRNQVNWLLNIMKQQQLVRQPSRDGVVEFRRESAELQGTQTPQTVYKEQFQNMIERLNKMELKIKELLTNQEAQMQRIEKQDEEIINLHKLLNQAKRSYSNSLNSQISEDGVYNIADNFKIVDNTPTSALTRKKLEPNKMINLLDV